MRIVDPKIKLSLEEKNILKHICRLIAKGEIRHNKFDNFGDNEIPLSDNEAELLVSLLEKLLNKREFFEADSFLKALTSLSPYEREKARSLFTKIYRRRHGNPVGVGYRWNELSARLGLKYHLPGERKIEQMSENHFWNMETKLFTDVGFDIHQVNNLIDVGGHIFKREKSLKINDSSMINIRSSISKAIADIAKNGFISKPNLYSTAFIVSNVVILFTTRDWSAAGVYSCMVGHSINSKPE